MKQKITKDLSTEDEVGNQFRTRPKELAITNGFSLSFMNENSRLSRRIKAGKTNGKKYKHVKL